MNKERKLIKDLHRLDVSIGRALCQQIGQSGMDEVSRANGHIIRFLNEHQNEDVYQRDLEHEFGITRSTASRVLTLMEQKGLVIRSSVQMDARLKKLTLTDKAQGIAHAMRERGRAMDERLLNGFSAQEREQLFTLIDRMQQNLKPVKEEKERHD